VNAMKLGRELAARRRDAGLTQAELARRIGTTQAAISKIESGRVLPGLPLIERIARATGRPIQLTLGEPSRPLSPAERRRRLRRALGDVEFNPWERSPSPAEAQSLISDGLTRERFEGRKTPI
jgi:transcriptional regulator with XRE-family HTH domain